MVTLKHPLTFLVVISLATTTVKAQVSDTRLQKNYFVSNSSLYVNEASLNSEKSQLVGSGQSFGIDYRRLIMNNEKLAIYALIGIDDFRIGYSGWIDNNGVNENFSAKERYIVFNGGFIASSKSRQNPLDFFDLEMAFAYWILNNQSYFVNGTSVFPKAESRLSLMFYWHYSKVFDNVKFCIGPFVNIDLAEFNERGEPFGLALFGIKSGLGIGF